MNVRLQINLEFPAGLYIGDQLRLNYYSVSIQLCTVTADPEQTNTAMERLKMFVYAELADTVFINQEDLERAQMLELLGMNITTLPEEPIDQIIGIALYCKLNAILEEKMIVTNVTIQSLLGDNVRYLHSSQESLGPCADPGWWTDSGPVHSNFKPATGGKRVVKINRTPTWRDMDLGWSGTEPPKNETNTVVFSKFPTDEN